MTDDATDAYLRYLYGLGRVSTARKVASYLAAYCRFLAQSGRTPATASVDDVEAYQAHLASPRGGERGPLSRSTQATRLGALRSVHRWLRRRGHAIADPTLRLRLPVTSARTVQTAYLDQQEAQALMDSAVARVAAETAGTKPWAAAARTAAMVALALATGRRRAGLCELLLGDLDADRAELRVTREKGRAGRVLPVAPWAVRLAVAYRDQARQVLLGRRESPFLFVGVRRDRVADGAFARALEGLVEATRAANPDLSGLAAKRISSHSLRVTCARLLFANGCPIRSVNEVLLHRELSTTVQYTPIPAEELRRAIAGAHPRG